MSMHLAQAKTWHRACSMLPHVSTKRHLPWTWASMPLFSFYLSTLINILSSEKVFKLFSCTSIDLTFWTVQIRAKWRKKVGSHIHFHTYTDTHIPSPTINIPPTQILLFVTIHEHKPATHCSPVSGFILGVGHSVYLLLGENTAPCHGCCNTMPRSPAALNNFLSCCTQAPTDLIPATVFFFQNVLQLEPDRI